MRRISFLLLMVVLLTGCTKPVPFQRNSNFVFGTVYNITYQYGEDLQQEIEAELMKVDGELQTVLSITDHAMATSGNYRNFYYQDGKKYAHTIDPRTGYPVQHSLLSATVIADDCATADAYATSFMVLGVDGAQEVLLRHPELMAYLIYVDEKGELAVWSSPALKDYE